VKDPLTDASMGDHLPLSAFEVLELPRRRSHPLLRALAGLGLTLVATASILGVCIMVGA
jgi:hypothetical protein